MELRARKPESRWLPLQRKRPVMTTPVMTIEQPALIPLEKMSNALTSYLPAITIMDTQLKETAEQIEQAVIDVCGNFEGISRRAKESVAKTAAFLASNQDSSQQDSSVEQLIEECQVTMETLLSAIEHAGEVSRKAVEQIRLIDGYSHKISTSLKQLDGIAEGNKILAINARIEAAHAGEAGAGFSIVANEVNAQAQKSHEVILQVTDLSGQLRDAARSAVKDLEKMDQRDRKSAEHSRKQVTTALNGFQDMHSRMKAMLGEMSSEGELLADDISAAIRGLQFQDRTGQRISHVRHGLETLQKKLEQMSQGEVAEHISITDDMLHSYTMHEERQAAGIQDSAMPGDIELF